MSGDKDTQPESTPAAGTPVASADEPATEPVAQPSAKAAPEQPRIATKPTESIQLSEDFGDSLKSDE